MGKFIKVLRFQYAEGYASAYCNAKASSDIIEFLEKDRSCPRREAQVIFIEKEKANEIAIDLDHFYNTPLK